jgi:hypothetical protein
MGMMGKRFRYVVVDVQVSKTKSVHSAVIHAGIYCGSKHLLRSVSKGTELPYLSSRYETMRSFAQQKVQEGAPRYVLFIYSALILLRSSSPLRNYHWTVTIFM